MIKINIPTLEELEKENPHLILATREELVTMVWILARQRALMEQIDEINARFDRIQKGFESIVVRGEIPK